MNGPSVTAHTETAILWAVLNEDDTEARRIVADMLPGEAAEYATQLNRVLGMLRTAHGEAVIPTGFEPRIRVLDDEGRFIRRRPAHEADDPEFTPGSGRIV